MARRAAHSAYPHLDEAENFNLADMSGSSDDEQGDDAEESAQANSIVDQDPIAVPGFGATFEDLLETLAAMQVQYVELRTRAQELVLENATLKTSVKPRKQRPVDRERDEHEALVMPLARKYSVTTSPWISRAAFVYKTRPQVDPHSAERYASPSAEEMASAAELFDLLPDELHPFIRHSDFSKMVMRHVNNGRSTMLNSLRSVSGQIFEMDQKCFEKGYDREADTKMQNLIRVDGKYARLPPLLFPEGTEMQMPKSVLFRSRRLALMVRVMLNGKHSLYSDDKAGPPACGLLWNIKSVEIGHISFVAMVARHLFSPDLKLSEVGHKTKIPYLADFHHYKMLLMSLKPEKLEKTIRFYNAIVFHGKTSPVNHGSNDATDNDDANDVAAFNESTDDEDNTALLYVPIPDIATSLSAADGELTITPSPISTPDIHHVQPPSRAPSPVSQPIPSSSSVAADATVTKALQSKKNTRRKAKNGALPLVQEETVVGIETRTRSRRGKP